MSDASFNEQARLIDAVARTLQQGGPLQRIDTHLSVILVAGPYAYKFKKALRFDFVDFSTLAARRFYCEEELRLNRRLAPELYLAVLPVGGSIQQPVLEAAGAPREYALKMRAFDQQALWSARIAQGRLGGPEADQLAHTLARFHRAAAAAPAASPWGGPALLAQTVGDSLALLATLAHAAPDRAALAALRQWQCQQQARLAGRFAQRKADGHVRECHGDLHCGNILTLDGRVVVFDCIEFNESLRWIDVISDVAFICMDLHRHGLPARAARLLNGYLEQSGDYAGVAVLRYYQTALALVRWKIALLRAQQLQDDPQAAAPHAAEAARYRDSALHFSRPGTAAIIITHGFSGSGKSTLARRLAEQLGALQIRSDVERKRWHGRDPHGAAAAAPGSGLYGEAATRATYARLRALAARISAAGMPVIVDAAFLKRAQRGLFAGLAAELGLPFFLLDLQADAATLRARVAARAARGDDASDAGLDVLEQQLAQHEALSPDETAQALALDSTAGPDALRRACAPLLAALGIGLETAAEID